MPEKESTMNNEIPAWQFLLMLALASAPAWLVALLPVYAPLVSP